MTAQGLAEQNVSRVEVNTFAQVPALYPEMPKTTSQAQYSLPFALVVRMVHGQIGPANIMTDGLRDPSVTKALRKIEVRETARHSKRFPKGR